VPNGVSSSRKNVRALVGLEANDLPSYRNSFDVGSVIPFESIMDRGIVEYHAKLAERGLINTLCSHPSLWGRTESVETPKLAD
jgi:hypothetical protein